MGDRTFQLAIETSAQAGSVAVGAGDALLGELTLPQPKRHRVELMPAIAGLCDAHGLTPSGLDAVYLSVGPGSFTGLRIGVTTAKMLAATTSARIAAIPTLDVVAANVPACPGVLAVCLNLKRTVFWRGLYACDEDRQDEIAGDDGQVNAGGWRATADAALRTLEEIVGETEGPLTLVGDPLGDAAAEAEGEMAGWSRVTVLPATYAQPRATAVWRLGRAAGAREDWTDAGALLPVYARRPEAETLWEQRHKSTQKPRQK